MGTKKVVIGGLLTAAALALIVFVAGPHLLKLWIGLRPEVRTALVGGAGTVIAASIAASMVIWQIGRQGRNAIEQTRHTERLKLKLEIYKDILRILRDASLAEVTLSSYLRRFPLDLLVYRGTVESGAAPQIPRVRLSDLTELKSDLDRKSVEIIRLTEEWQIIDPRFSVFRTAVNVAKHDISEAYLAYFDLARRLYPLQLPNSDQPLPWQPPDETGAADLEARAEALSLALMMLGNFVNDFRVEAQNHLLGDLFPHRAPPRQPLDPNIVVVTLARHADLETYFESKTGWGAEKRKAEERVRAANAERGRAGVTRFVTPE